MGRPQVRGRRLITLDTSALYALANRRDRHHAAAREVLEGDRGPQIVPAGILAEAAYLIEGRLGHRVLDAVLRSLQEGELTLDCGEQDFPRIRELVGRYADIDLGFADASVVACAERNGGAVLSFDRRDFGIVAREGTINPRPDG